MNLAISRVFGGRGELDVPLIASKAIVAANS